MSSDAPDIVSRRSLLLSAGVAGATVAMPKIVAQAGAAEKSSINLDGLGASGVYRTMLRHALPDSHGVHLERRLIVTSVEFAVAYAGQWWPAGGNRVYPHVSKGAVDAPEGTLFLLVKETHERYLALLPMADDEAYAWFSGGGDLTVKLGTHGRSELDGDKALFAWARGETAYGAISAAWKTGLNSMAKKTVSLRGEKTYPEMFQYLGWCSWEAYGPQIDEAKMLHAVHRIENSGVPIRYFLMDEGHADNQTLQASAAKFPNGYGVLTGKKSARGIRWFGLWWAFLGAAHGVPVPGKLGTLRGAMMEAGNNVLIPKPDEASAMQFYEHLMAVTREGGFDFVKIDFMVDALPLYAGLRKDIPTLGGLPPDNSNAIRNPYAGAAKLMEVCEQSARAMRGIMNCNWHNAACLFHSGASVVGRCSEDYKSNVLDRAKAHLYHAFSAMPWLGQLAWGDHDMFHSSDRVAALPMAISKALSGGPIYLSDEPDQFVKTLIDPLCFSDGRLLRPLAPGAPVSEDLSYVPDGGRLLRVIAPLRHGCAAIGIFHLEGDAGHGRPITTSIPPALYTEGSSMMQPAEKPWIAPPEGLLVYDVLHKKAERLSPGHTVSMSQFGCELLQMSPIREGWALVGHVDKYLPAMAVRNVEYGRDRMSFLLEEAGEVAVWSSRGIPAIQGVPMKELMPHLYGAQIGVEQVRQLIEVTRGESRASESMLG